MFRGRQGPRGSMVPEGAPADMSRAYVEIRDCDFCGKSFVRCSRFGQSMFMCISCEYKIVDRLKLILKLE